MNWISTVRLFPSRPILYNSGTKRPDTHMKEIKNWKSEPTSPLSRLTILRMPCRPSPPYMFVVAWAETAHVPLLTMNSLGFDSNHCSVVLLTHCYASRALITKSILPSVTSRKNMLVRFIETSTQRQKSGILLVAYQRARFSMVPEHQMLHKLRYLIYFGSFTGAEWRWFRDCFRIIIFWNGPFLTQVLVTRSAPSLYPVRLV